MSGSFTRLMYDNCAYNQSLRQSTDPLELVLDPTKYVNRNNLCRADGTSYPPNGALLVDVESSLLGMDKTASECTRAKHPFCGPSGCLLTKDPRVAPHITPYACEWGRTGSNSVIQTNMRKPTDPGYGTININKALGRK